MPESLDLAVVGSGPCGIAVGAAAAREGVNALLIDQGCITNSLVDYPLYMTFFSTAVKLEIGDVPFTIPEPKPTRRQALAYYRHVVQHHGMRVRQYEEVLEVSSREGGFDLQTRTKAGIGRAYRARAIVIATGCFHEPNWLGVPGEDLPKVLHYYKEPYPFYQQDVLVVGGSNSAVESALELYRNGARVTMVHFAESIDSGVKPWVVPDITNRIKNGEIPAHWKHRVVEIRPSSVVIVHEDGEETEIANDWVLAMTGWRSDPTLLHPLGVHIDPETGIPEHDPETMETNAEGVFIAGVLAAGNNANKIFIENGKHHGPKIVRTLVSRWQLEAESVGAL